MPSAMSSLGVTHTLSQPFSTRRSPERWRRQSEMLLNRHLRSEAIYLEAFVMMQQYLARDEDALCDELLGRDPDSIPALFKPPRPGALAAPNQLLQGPDEDDPAGRVHVALFSLSVLGASVVAAQHPEGIQALGLRTYMHPCRKFGCMRVQKCVSAAATNCDDATSMIVLCGSELCRKLSQCNLLQ